MSRGGGVIGGSYLRRLKGTGRKRSPGVTRGRRYVGRGEPDSATGRGISWKQVGSVNQALYDLQGNASPLLVFLHATDAKDDCCGAKFTYLFGYSPLIRISRHFECVMISTSLKHLNRQLDGTKLHLERSALLVVDPEGGLIHLQDGCIDGDRLVRLLKRDLRVHRTRIVARRRSRALIQQARDQIEEERYARALGTLSRVLGNPGILPPEDAERAARERTRVIGIGEELLQEARELLEGGRPRSALRTFRNVRREFGSVTPLRREARKGIRGARAALDKGSIAGH
ncbi:MAG: hypothetical protein ACE5GW_02365 [Planctomycetota bacterium]